MEPHVIQARVTIAAAIIASGKYGIGHAETEKHWKHVESLKQLRKIVDAYYEAITGSDA